MSVPWWKRRRENPWSSKALLGLFLFVFGGSTLIGSGGVLGRVVGAVAMSVGLFLYGDGLWWRTDRQRE